MKTLPSQLPTLLRHAATDTRAGRRRLVALARFLAVLAAMVGAYSLIFHWLMAREGQDFTWVTGIYWTLTVMSTLGFGDITFHSDIGRLFSLLVLLSGMIFLLILLPFTFIELFYEPLMREQRAARAPRELPEDTANHVILTREDPVTRALIPRLENLRHPYVLLVPDVEEALRLHDEGVSVGVGRLDEPETYERMRVRQAALVATTHTDVINTNVALQVAGITNSVPIVATAENADSVDILQLAGCRRVVHLTEILGQWLANRMVGVDALSHVTGRFGELLVAQASAHRTPLVGKTLQENRIRAKVGASVVGVWERGALQSAHPDTAVGDDTILILAGTRAQLDAYDELFAIYNVAAAPVVVIGAGGVGRATSRALLQREIDHRIVEQNSQLIEDPERDILGNAADLAVLKRAGILEAPAVVITTNDDDMNVYLTVYCRKLRPDIQIISRATEERTVSTLHRAGADTVVSYASLGATLIINRLRRDDIVMLAEGVELFRIAIPKKLVGQAVRDCGVRERAGCSVAAIEAQNQTIVNPTPDYVFPEDGVMILLGNAETEARFMDCFVNE